MQMQVQSFKGVMRQFYDVIVFAVLVLSSLILIFQPLIFKQKIAATIGFPFLTPMQKMVDYVAEIHRLKEENRELKQLIADLSVQNSRATFLWNENSRLSSIFNFVSQFQYPAIAAQVIAYDSQRPERTFVLNKGAIHHIRPNSAVLTLKGLAGKTLVVDRDHTVVQSLQDRNCKVSVIDTRSREVGILAWTPEASFHLIYIPPRANIQIGDTLATSGYGGIFPKNIPVGQVIASAFDQQEQQLKVQVAPFADLNGIEEVIVVAINDLMTAPDSANATIFVQPGGEFPFPQANAFSALANEQKAETTLPPAISTTPQTATPATPKLPKPKVTPHPPPAPDVSDTLMPELRRRE